MSYKKGFRKRLSANELQPIEKIFNENILPVANAFIRDKKELESEGIDPSQLEGYIELYEQYVTPYREARAKYEELKNNGIKFKVEYQFDESNLEDFARKMKWVVNEINKLKELTKIESSNSMKITEEKLESLNSINEDLLKLFEKIELAYKNTLMVKTIEFKNLKTLIELSQIEFYNLKIGNTLDHYLKTCFDFDEYLKFFITNNEFHIE